MSGPHPLIPSREKRGEYLRGEGMMLLGDGHDDVVEVGGGRFGVWAGAVRADGHVVEAHQNKAVLEIGQVLQRQRPHPVARNVHGRIQEQRGVMREIALDHKRPQHRQRIPGRAVI